MMITMTSKNPSSVIFKDLEILYYDLVLQDLDELK